MPVRVRSQILLASALVLFGTAGCGAAADKASERLVEKAAEEAAGGDANVDLSDGKVKIETEDGTFSAGSGELPEGWPKDIPMAKGLTIVSSSNIGSEGQTMLSVIGETKTSPADVMAGLEDGLSGWTRESTYDASSGGDTSVSSTYKKANATLAVIAGTSGDTGTTTVSYAYQLDETAGN